MKPSDGLLDPEYSWDLPAGIPDPDPPYDPRKSGDTRRKTAEGDIENYVVSVGGVPPGGTL
jgi:hypothetical protein